MHTNQAPSNLGNIADGFVNDSTDKTVEIANAVGIKTIINAFGYHLDSKNQMVCPFYYHKNGSEKTGSFCVYEKTNSFHCFGCKTSGGTVKFVSALRKLHYLSAAEYILANHNHDLSKLTKFNYEDSCERELIIIEFSSMIRDFIQTHKSSEALMYAEKVSFTFDKMLFKRRELDNSAIKILTSKLNKLLNNFRGTCRKP